MTTTINIDPSQSVEDFHDWVVVEQIGYRYYLVQAYYGEKAAMIGLACCENQSQKNQRPGVFSAFRRAECQLVRSPKGGDLWLDRSV